MKRLLLFLFAIIACIHLSYAQKGFKVEIAMGAILPIDEFNSTDFKDNSSGFSESGFLLNFDGDYYFHNRIAISARFHFGLSSINELEVINWLKSDLSEYLKEDSENNLYDIGYWQWSAPLIGLKLNYPIILNKLYFDTGVFSGFSITQIPTQSFKIIDDENKRDIYSENLDKTSVTIPIMVDAGIRMILNQNIQIKLLSSYFQTNVEYEHASYMVEENSNVINENLNSSKFEIPLKTLNISLGIIYNLNKKKD